jgi:hypothetical protein
MGISIKNDEVEKILREFARERNLSLTAAIEQAITNACRWEKRAQSMSEEKKEAAWQALLDSARNSPYASDGVGWSRDELYDR